MKTHASYFSGFYIFSYAAIGALFPLIAQYLHGIGFSGSQIGVITASSTAIGILSNSFWGGIYHRMHRSKKLILLLCVITAVLVAAVNVGGEVLDISSIIYPCVFLRKSHISPD